MRKITCFRSLGVSLGVGLLLLLHPAAFCEDVPTITVSKGDRVNLAVTALTGGEGVAATKTLQNDLALSGFFVLGGANATFTARGSATGGSLQGLVVDHSGSTVLSKFLSAFCADASITSELGLAAATAAIARGFVKGMTLGGGVEPFAVREPLPVIEGIKPSARCTRVDTLRSTCVLSSIPNSLKGGRVTRGIERSVPAVCAVSSAEPCRFLLMSARATGAMCSPSGSREEPVSVQH